MSTDFNLMYLSFKPLLQCTWGVVSDFFCRKVGSRVCFIPRLGIKNLNKLYNKTSDRGSRNLSPSHSSKRYFSSESLNNKLHPWFITGFTDGEGCFSISVIKDNKSKSGWRVKVVFEVFLHIRDIDLLWALKKSFLNVGNIYSQNTKCNYFVYSVKDLQVIIEHFNNYPLITQKQTDFFLFKQALDLVSRKEHLTLSGLQKIVSIKSAMASGGISDELKAAFKSNILPVQSPSVLDYKIKDLNWLAGFIAAEGCFYVKVSKSKTHKLGVVVQLKLKITQHTRDIELMQSLVKFFGCGLIEKRLNSNVCDFIVYSHKDIWEKIIPFFEKYPIQGVKYEDFMDFCKVALLIKNKAHLTQQGIEEILNIKSRMNTKRQLVENK